MTWISPRKDGENAKAVGERIAADYERQLGRALTPEELASVHAYARDVVSYWGRNARRQADRERELGRPLTPDEMTELVREADRERAADDTAGGPE